MSGITTHIAGAVLGVAIGLGAVLPVSTRHIPIDVLETEVMTRAVPQGGELDIRFVVDRREVCPTTAIRTIFDGAGYEWKLPEETRPAFGPQTTEEKLVHYTVPPGAAPGVGRFRLVLSFHCNWAYDLLPVTLVLPDLPFTITEE